MLSYSDGTSAAPYGVGYSSGSGTVPNYRSVSRRPYLIQSPPVRVRWLGFESDLYTMQREGWLIAMHRNPQYCSIHFAVEHPVAKIKGFTGEVREMDLVDYNPEQFSMVSASLDLSSAPINIMSMPPPGEYVPVDCEPQMIEIQRITDFSQIFRPVPRAPDAILLDRLSLDEVLAMARDKQRPIDEQWAKFKRDQNVLENYKQASTPNTLLRLVS